MHLGPTYCRALVVEGSYMSQSDHKHVGFMMAKPQNLAAMSRESALTAADERQLRKLDEQEWRLDVTVTAVVPELGIAVAHSTDDQELCLRESTPGIRWRDLREGQKLKLKLKGVIAPRVLSAALVA
jgi:hypothetical protein